MKENPNPKNQPEKVPGSPQFSESEIVSIPPEALKKMQVEGWPTLEEQKAYWNEQAREQLTCPKCERTFTHECLPRHGEQSQEWTPHWERVGDIDYRVTQATCDKHNAALAAEREKREQAVKLQRLTEDNEIRWMQRCDKHEKQLELAWGIIANAGGGDWEKESKEWQDAAVKWRAHKAALADERENGKAAWRRVVILEQQLAAERTFQWKSGFETGVKHMKSKLAAERENLALATQMVAIESKRANQAEEKEEPPRHVLD
jgi:hypothetical protein